MPKNKYKIKIPRTPIKFAKLLKTILDKHLADGPESKLNALDMEAVMVTFAAFEEQRRLSEELVAASRRATRQRNQLMGILQGQGVNSPGSLLSGVASIRDLLSGIFKGKEYLLSAWGFRVIESATNKVITDTFENDSSTESD